MPSGLGPEVCIRVVWMVVRLKCLWTSLSATKDKVIIINEFIRLCVHTSLKSMTAFVNQFRSISNGYKENQIPVLQLHSSYFHASMMNIFIIITMKNLVIIINIIIVLKIPFYRNHMIKIIVNIVHYEIHH